MSKLLVRSLNFTAIYSSQPLLELDYIDLNWMGYIVTL